MKHPIEFSTVDGQAIVVEVDEAVAAGTIRAGRPDEVAERAAQTFEAAPAPIKLTADALIAKLRDVSDRPAEVNIAFAIKLSARAGAVIASTVAGANFQVTLN